VTGFAMLERDTVTGLNLAVYREENPGTGRWGSQDPSSFSAGSMNLYGYVSNEPDAYSDMSGLAAHGPLGWDPKSQRLHGDTDRANFLNPDVIGDCKELAAWIRTLVQSVTNRLIEWGIKGSLDQGHSLRLANEYALLQTLVAWYMQCCGGGNFPATLLNPSPAPFQPTNTKPMYGRARVGPPAAQSQADAEQFFRYFFPLRPIPPQASGPSLTTPSSNSGECPSQSLPPWLQSAEAGFLLPVTSPPGIVTIPGSGGKRGGRGGGRIPRGQGSRVPGRVFAR